MAKKLRLGIIGCGDIAGYIAWMARLNPNIRLAACIDTSPQRVAQFAQRFGIPHVGQEYKPILRKELIDAVYIAVPHHLHYAMLKDAIDAGIHVLVEKPVTRTLEEAKKIQSILGEESLCVGVNYQYRYDAGCFALAQSARSGDLGRIHSIRCNLAWQREEAYFEASSWHAQNAKSGGGTLITQGSHLLDIALWALDEKPALALGYTARRKFTKVEVEDLAHAIVEMESGASVQISSTMAATPEQGLRIEVYGSRGTAIYTNRPWPRVAFLGVRVRKARPPVWGLHALQRSLEGFRRWALGGSAYLTPLHEAIPVLATVEAIYRSARSGRRERIEI